MTASAVVLLLNCTASRHDDALVRTVQILSHNFITLPFFGVSIPLNLAILFSYPHAGILFGGWAPNDYV